MFKLTAIDYWYLRCASAITNYTMQRCIVIVAEIRYYLFSIFSCLLNYNTTMYREFVTSRVFPYTFAPIFFRCSFDFRFNTKYYCTFSRAHRDQVKTIQTNLCGAENLSFQIVALFQPDHRHFFLVKNVKTNRTHIQIGNISRVVIGVPNFLAFITACPYMHFTLFSITCSN